MGVSKDRRRDLLRVGALALGARVLVTVAISAWLAASGREFLFPDEADYFDEAKWLYEGGGPSSHAYAKLLRLIFLLTKPNPWVGRIVSVIAGSLVALLIYELVRLIAGRGPALVAGIATALWPSLILWSSVGLRDSLILLCVFGSLLGAMRAMRGSWAGVAGAVVLMAGLQALRPYAFVAASIGLVAVATLQASRNLRLMAPVLVLIIAIGVVGVATQKGFLGWRYASNYADAKLVVKIRVEEGSGNTGFGKPSGPLHGIPRGVLFTVLGPFPWTPGSAVPQALLWAELPIWYAVLFVGAKAAWRLRWRRLIKGWGLSLAFSLCIVVVMAVYQGNAGTALRHRAMIIPTVIGLAATTLSPQPLRRRANPHADSLGSTVLSPSRLVRRYRSKSSATPTLASAYTPGEKGTE